MNASWTEAPRLYVTGTDTDVGKTRVSAAVARALRAGGEREVTIVKIVQTGLPPGVPGDAEEAALAAGCRALELARFPKPADAWTAALEADAQPLQAADVAARLQAVPGPLVAEGSGGAAVPLNETETISDVAALCGLRAIVTVGLRLGCISHAILSLEYLAARSIPVLGAVLCERRPLEDPGYPAEVERVLRARCRVLGSMPFEPDPARCIERSYHLFTEFLCS